MKPKTTLKARALRYLSIREYSPKELARKLSSYVEEGDDLAALMEWLQKQGFLSEERFAEAFGSVQHVMEVGVSFANSKCMAWMKKRWMKQKS